jgi:hypothetical protein
MYVSLLESDIVLVSNTHLLTRYKKLLSVIEEKPDYFTIKVNEEEDI